MESDKLPPYNETKRTSDIKNAATQMVACGMFGEGDVEFAYAILVNLLSTTNEAAFEEVSNRDTVSEIRETLCNGMIEAVNMFADYLGGTVPLPLGVSMCDAMCAVYTQTDAFLRVAPLEHENHSEMAKKKEIAKELVLSVGKYTPVAMVSPEFNRLYNKFSLET